MRTNCSFIWYTAFSNMQFVRVPPEIDLPF